MREALPNAFLFGLTGTPINRADKNTFYAFGADTDDGGYMSRYGLNDSIRDGATKELHFEPRMVDLHIDQKAIEEAYAELTQGLTDEDRDRLGKAAAKMSILVKAPERIRAICGDIAKQRKWAGKKLDGEGWKRLLVDAWARAEGKSQGQVVPSLDGNSVLNLGIQTRRLPVGDMADLITFAQAWAVENDVRLGA